MKVLFFVNEAGPPKSADYQHSVIVLAEGFKNLKINFDANVDYYKIDEGYLFNKKTIDDMNEYDYIITGYTCGIIDGKKTYPNKNTFLTKEILMKNNRKYKTVLLDWSDGLFTNISEHKYYDFHFVSNYNKLLKEKFNNIYPMCFCASNRIIDGCKVTVPIEKRKIPLLYSHRVEHDIRNYAKTIYSQFPSLCTYYNDNFTEPDKNDDIYIDWAQSGRRHNIEFYNTLQNTILMDCTGGYVKNGIFYQVDSWKLWEAFFSGCCVLMIDLDKANIIFPNQPINMVHYIGFSMDYHKDIELMKEIISGKIDYHRIARQGNEWAKNNYNPSSFAKYILSVINK